MDLGAPIINPNNEFYNQNKPFASTYLLPDGDDRSSQRPDIVPGVPVTLSNPRPATPNSSGSPLINLAAFQAPPVDANGNFTRFGNEGNGIIRAPHVWQIDLALTKETKLTERLNMSFAVQAFNIFNHVQLADPGSLTLAYAPGANSANLAAPSDFGIISSSVNYNNNNDNAAPGNTGTGTPRQLQFMVRFKF